MNSYIYFSIYIIIEGHIFALQTIKTVIKYLINTPMRQFKINKNFTNRTEESLDKYLVEIDLLINN